VTAVFERFTADARRIVVLGMELAHDLKHDYLGTEHLLLALARTGPNIATRSMIASGFDPVRARHDLERLVGPGADGLTESDAAALRTIGVDLDEVRRRTEAAFGRGALERRRLWHGRRRSRVCGLPFMPNAKKALELALREAIALGHRWIGPEHMLLGLLREGSMAAELLVAQGIELGNLRDEVIRDIRDLGERGA
jgi:ATP-dependent Clp protease ATP-binding subunit ClpA